MAFLSLLQWSLSLWRVGTVDCIRFGLNILQTFTLCTLDIYWPSCIVIRSFSDGRQLGNPLIYGYNDKSLGVESILHFREIVEGFLLESMIHLAIGSVMVSGIGFISRACPSQRAVGCSHNMNSTSAWVGLSFQASHYCSSPGSQLPKIDPFLLQ